MADRYSSFARTRLGSMLVTQLGLPDPPRLRRHRPGRPVLDGPVLLGTAPGGRAGKALDALLAELGATTQTTPAQGERYSAVVFDASGITDATQLRSLYDFVHPAIRSLRPSGRLLVIGADPAAAAGEAAAQQALEGFVRSAGKELKRGATAQLLRLAAGGEDAAESTLRFLLSARSAYVSGQVVTVRGAELPAERDWEHPLHGRIALVTGAARGIGAAIAEVLARDGAHVVCLDVPAAGDALAAVANRVGGSALQCDLTWEDAPERIVERLRTRHGGVDVVVHNAGVTRDRTLGRMSEAEWDTVLAVNLVAPERITDALVDSGMLRGGGRVVALSSMAGIAGNAGQTNYAASKAGVIGLVRAQAAQLADRPITVNAVAPGFIETEMTAAMPTLTREAGRRLNSMSQGGLPVDVAESVAWLAAPTSAGVTGQVVRVCGQHLMGA